MTRALLIDAVNRMTIFAEVDDFRKAYTQVGLDMDAPGGVDHGTVTQPSDDRPGLAIVVAGFGLYVPPEQQNYFSINKELYAGNAVLYGYDHEGETIDVPDRLPTITFFTGVADVERAIAAGAVYRPATSVNGQVLWQWPAR